MKCNAGLKWIKAIIYLNIDQKVTHLRKQFCSKIINFSPEPIITSVPYLDVLSYR